jgi:hypothetical protein
VHESASVGLHESLASCVAHCDERTRRYWSEMRERIERRTTLFPPLDSQALGLDQLARRKHQLTISLLQL